MKIQARILYVKETTMPGDWKWISECVFAQGLRMRGHGADRAAAIRELQKQIAKFVLGNRWEYHMINIVDDSNNGHPRAAGFGTDPQC